MASRNNLPLLMLGTLGGITASLGAGWGLGQYTVSGLNPFYTTPVTPAYQPVALAQNDPFPALYDPSARTD